MTSQSSHVRASPTSQVLCCLVCSPRRGKCQVLGKKIKFVLESPFVCIMSVNIVPTDIAFARPPLCIVYAANDRSSEGSERCDADQLKVDIRGGRGRGGRGLRLGNKLLLHVASFSRRSRF